jgi:hypothetical protein
MTKIKKKKKTKAIKPYKDSEGNVFKPHAFMVEDFHPVVGRILIVDGKRYKVLDDYPSPHQGTFIKPMNDEDEDRINEYNMDINELSEKLVEKVDLKRMIKELIKKKSPQEIKTGLYILKKEKEGEKIEVNHGPGCYSFLMAKGDLIFEFCSGSDIVEEAR